MNPPIKIEPLLDHDLEEACSFLQTHLNPNLDSKEWANSYRYKWHPNRPNHGFLLRCEEKIVGVFMAIYSQRQIRGQMESFCNPNSWVVEKPYRTHSKKLLDALLNQQGFHFFITTPNPIVVALFKRKKFRFMGDQTFLIPNIPWLKGRNIQILSDISEIEKVLEPNANQIMKDHKEIPWLIHRAIGKPGQWCHIILKKRIWKKAPSAQLLHISDPNLFLDYLPTFGNHLLFQFGMLTTQIETRFLNKNPILFIKIHELQPKMFSSLTLGEADMGYIYSESTALDL